MKQSTMEAYAEVDTILGFMNEKYLSEIPEKLRKMFREKKDKNHVKNIVPNKSLKEQGISKETLAILAVLNYNYWCKDEERKKELLKQYSENEERYQKELREKYNSDDIFKNKDNKEKVKVTELVEYKEPKWYKKIFNRILSIFKR